MMGPIYCVGSERAVAYPRAPSLSSFSFNNFFTSSLFHFFSSYFLFFHFCPDFPKENSTLTIKTKKPTSNVQNPKENFIFRNTKPKSHGPKSGNIKPKSNLILKQTPKPKSKNLLFRNTKPKSNFIFQTPNPDLDGRIGRQLWW